MSCDWTSRAIMARSGPRSSRTEIVMRLAGRAASDREASAARLEGLGARPDLHPQVGRRRHHPPLPADLDGDLSLVVLVLHRQLELEVRGGVQMERPLPGLEA